VFYCFLLASAIARVTLPSGVCPEQGLSVTMVVSVSHVLDDTQATFCIINAFACMAALRCIRQAFLIVSVTRQSSLQIDSEIQYSDKRTASLLYYS